MVHDQNTYFDVYQLEDGDVGAEKLRFFASMWNFGIGSAALARQHREFLEELVVRSTAPGDGAIWLQLRGLASRSGDRKRNLQLSARRAEAVIRYLLERGLDSNRLISADGWGEEEWMLLGVADGTENYTHRAVHMWCWLEDPRQYDRKFPLRFLKSAGIVPGRQRVRP